jgi:transposase-like protein
MSNPFRYFNSSPEVIRLVVMMYVRYPLSLRNVEDLLHPQAGIVLFVSAQKPPKPPAAP